MDDGVLRRASNEGDETFAVVRAAGAKGRGKPRARGGRAPLSLADPRLNGGATASADGGIASGDGGGGGGGGRGGHAPRALCRGAAVSLCALLAFFAVTCALLGLIFGGGLQTDASLLDTCSLVVRAYPTYNLKCPY